MFQVTGSGMGASLVEVLVIEDDQVLGAQLGELLRLQGYRVRSSPLGECGLAMALTKAPDLILLDVILPDVNGFRYYGVCASSNRRRLSC